MSKKSAFTKEICHKGQHVPLEPPDRHISMYTKGGLHRLFRQITHPQKLSLPMYEYGQFTDKFGHFRPSLGTVMAYRYRVKDIISTQGQSAVLVLAEDLFYQKKVVVIKVLHASRYQLGAQETHCLWRLALADPEGNSNTVRYLNTFTFHDHYCMVFKALVPLALTDIFQDIPAEKVIQGIRKVAVRLLSTLGFLRQQNVIHADLKPENILLSNRDSLSSVTVIDFGNAIQHVHKEIALYYEDFELQTPLYRAPEVMFGIPFGTEIDVWSLGCILAELYLSKPLFMGNSKMDIMHQITVLLGPFPVQTFQRGKFYSKFKQFTETVEQPDATEILLEHLGCRDYLFADFLARLLRYNPDERMTPFEAAKHSFLAAEFPFAYLLPPSSDGGGSYSTVHIPPSKYKHQPAVASDIRRSQPSTYDILCLGTSLRERPEEESHEKGGHHQRHEHNKVAKVNPVQRVPSPSKRSEFISLSPIETNRSHSEISQNVNLTTERDVNEPVYHKQSLASNSSVTFNGMTKEKSLEKRNKEFKVVTSPCRRKRLSEDRYYQSALENKKEPAQQEKSPVKRSRGLWHITSYQQSHSAGNDFSRTPEEQYPGERNKYTRDLSGNRQSPWEETEGKPPVQSCKRNSVSREVTQESYKQLSNRKIKTPESDKKHRVCSTDKINCYQRPLQKDLNSTFVIDIDNSHTSTDSHSFPGQQGSDSIPTHCRLKSPQTGPSGTGHKIVRPSARWASTFAENKTYIPNKCMQRQEYSNINRKAELHVESSSKFENLSVFTQSDKLMDRGKSNRNTLGHHTLCPDKDIDIALDVKNDQQLNKKINIGEYQAGNIHSDNCLKWNQKSDEHLIKFYSDGGSSETQSCENTKLGSVHTVQGISMKRPRTKKSHDQQQQQEKDPQYKQYRNKQKTGSIGQSKTINLSQPDDNRKKLMSLMKDIMQEQALAENDLSERESERQLAYQVWQNLGKSSKDGGTLMYESISEDDFQSCEEPDKPVQKNERVGFKIDGHSGEEQYDYDLYDYQTKSKPGKSTSFKHINEVHQRSRNKQRSSTCFSVSEEKPDGLNQLKSHILANQQYCNKNGSVPAEDKSEVLKHRSAGKCSKHEIASKYNKYTGNCTFTVEQTNRSFTCDSVKSGGMEKVGNTLKEETISTEAKNTLQEQVTVCTKFQPDNSESDEEMASVTSDAVEGSENGYDSGPSKVTKKVTRSGKKTYVNNRNKHSTDNNNRNALCSDDNNRNALCSDDNNRNSLCSDDNNRNTLCSGDNRSTLSHVTGDKNTKLTAVEKLSDVKIPIRIKSRKAKRRLYFSQALKPLKNKSAKGILTKSRKRTSSEVTQNRRTNKWARNTGNTDDPYRFLVTPQKMSLRQSSEIASKEKFPRKNFSDYRKHKQQSIDNYEGMEKKDKPGAMENTEESDQQAITETSRIAEKGRTKQKRKAKHLSKSVLKRQKQCDDSGLDNITQYSEGYLLDKFVKENQQIDQIKQHDVKERKMINIMRENSRTKNAFVVKNKNARRKVSAVESDCSYESSDIELSESGEIENNSHRQKLYEHDKNDSITDQIGGATKPETDQGIDHLHVKRIRNLGVKKSNTTKHDRGSYVELDRMVKPPSANKVRTNLVAIGKSNKALLRVGHASKLFQLKTNMKNGLETSDCDGSNSSFKDEDETDYHVRHKKEMKNTEDPKDEMAAEFYSSDSDSEEVVLM